MPMERTPTPPAESALPEGAERLDSWKEIAAYLRRDERTVRRWLKIGLPVHRHLHKRKATVFAYKAEIDAWWKNGRHRVEHLEPGERVVRSNVILRLGLIALAGVLVAGATVWWHFMAKSRPGPGALSAAPLVSLPGWVASPTFSPDGNQIAFVWSGEKDEQSDVYVQIIGGGPPLNLTKNSPLGGLCPAWSPDGKQIAFVRQSSEGNDLLIIPALGGPERKLAHLEAQWPFSVMWHPDGKSIAFADRKPPEEPYSVILLSVETRERRRLTAPSEPGVLAGDRTFAFSPDGKRLAFVRFGSRLGSPNTLYVVSLEGGAPRPIFSENVSFGGIAWTADSRDLVFSSDVEGSSKLWRIPASGGVPELLPYGENVSAPAVAPRGNRLAFERHSSDADLGRLSLASQTGPAISASPPANSNRDEAGPQVSPDGRKIAFVSHRSGSGELWVANLDGTDAVQLTSFGSRTVYVGGWSPDGRQIAFSGWGNPPEPAVGIYVVGRDGGTSRRLTPPREEFAGWPTWSRRGNLIYAARRREDGGLEIWKIAIGGGAPSQVTRQGGYRAQESFDGRFLYYTKLEAPGVWRMPVEGGEEVKVFDLPGPWFSGYWTVVSEGMYFLFGTEEKLFEIRFLNLATGKVSRVAAFPGTPDNWEGGFSVSPDRRWIIYSHVSYRRQEILLVENFR